MYIFHANNLDQFYASYIRAFYAYVVIEGKQIITKKKESKTVE